MLLRILYFLLGYALLANCCNAQAQNPQRANALTKIKTAANAEKVPLITKFLTSEKNNNQADSLYKIAYDIIEANNNIQAKIELLNAYGIHKRNTSQYAHALNLHRQALELAEQKKWPHYEITILNNIGVVYRRLDENSTALNYHIDALKLAVKIGDDFNTSVALNSIGNIHITLGNYRDAISYFNRCLPIARKVNNKLGIAMNLNNIGESYEYLNILDSAKIYYDSSLYYNRIIESDKGIAICYNSIGNILKKQGHLQQAKQLFEKALDINNRLADRLFVANNLNNLGDVQNRLYNFTTALTNFKAAVAITLDIGSKVETKNSYHGMMNAFEGMHQYDSALIYSKLARLYGDSIVLESNNRHVRQMEAIYEKEAEKSKIELLESKQKFNRIVIVAITGIIILLCSIIASFIFRRRLKEKNFKLEKELEVRAQIAQDLHDDLGSTLSSIAIFSELLKRDHSNEKFQELQLKLDKNAKDSMEVLDDIIWLISPLNDKLFNLKQRIQDFAIPLMQSKNITYHINIDEAIADHAIDMKMRKNIFLIIKEAVNNLVKYSCCSEATIELKQGKNGFRLTIADNGKGFDLLAVSSRNGIKNMRQRAIQINGNLSINSTNNGTIIELDIPL